MGILPAAEAPASGRARELASPEQEPPVPFLVTDDDALMAAS
jgi:hypothetical protein